MGGVLLRFKGCLTEGEGSGTVAMTGTSTCSETWRVTKRSVN